ncbi:protein transport protein HofB [Citrobacter freundii]|nr:protein transport protein HofB [Citrobacter freundii]
MNTTQLTALCQRYQGILLDADNEVVHIAVVDAPSPRIAGRSAFRHHPTYRHCLLDAVSKWKAIRIRYRKCSRQCHEKQRQRSRLAESDVSIRSGATGF